MIDAQNIEQGASVRVFQTQVVWLRERVENLGRELVLAKRDSGRLAKQLKVRRISNRRNTAMLLFHLCRAQHYSYSGGPQ